MNIQSFEGSFAPLLPSQVDCLIRAFTFHTFHTIRIRTMPDNHMSHFQVLSVRTVMASSSIARVVSDVEVFREERTGEESKMQFVLQGAGLPQRDYELG